MSVLVVLLAVSIALALSALAAFIWAVKSGQFDDLSLPPERLILEDADSGS